MDEWTWITRTGAAAALVLSTGNSAKLWWDARRASRADAKNAAANRELQRLVRHFREQGRGRRVSWNTARGRTCRRWNSAWNREC